MNSKLTADNDDFDGDDNLFTAQELRKQIKKLVKSRTLKRDLLQLLDLSIAVADNVSGYGHEEVEELYSFLA